MGGSVSFPPAFVSYSRDDSEFALRLVKDLTAAGASVWLDQVNLVAGQRWDRAIEIALTRCGRRLVILSPAAVASENVMDEISFAIDEQKEIIPVLYGDCAVPLRLRRFQNIDFRADYERGLQKLVKTLWGSRRNTRTRLMVMPWRIREICASLGRVCRRITGKHASGTKRERPSSAWCLRWARGEVAREVRR